MKTKIISAFPGMGKTYYYNQHKLTSVDSDSSKFSWIIESDGTLKRNPDFPADYINHIKGLIGTCEYIFVSSHKEVRDALKEAGLDFYLVVPPTYVKDQMMVRYTARGNSSEFVKLISENWEDWIHDCYQETDCTLVIFDPFNSTMEIELDLLTINELSDIRKTSDTKFIYHMDYWDGPITGLIKWHGNVRYFRRMAEISKIYGPIEESEYSEMVKWSQENNYDLAAEDRYDMGRTSVYYVYAIPRTAVMYYNLRHFLFRLLVGKHTDYNSDNKRSHGKLKPRWMWPVFYKVVHKVLSVYKPNLEQTSTLIGRFKLS